MDLSAAQPYVSLVLVGLVVTASPGPATLAVMATGAAFGPRRSAPYLVGSVLGTIAVLVVVGAGLATALLAQPVLAPFLLVLAVGYLVHLAWRIATAPPPAASAPDHVRAPTWAGGVTLACTNPKAYAGLGTALASSEGAVATGARMAVLATLIVLGQLAWLAAGSALASTLRHPAHSRTVNVLMSLALLVSTVPAVLTLVR